MAIIMICFDTQSVEEKCNTLSILGMHVQYIFRRNEKNTCTEVEFTSDKVDYSVIFIQLQQNISSYLK